jgi:hypothetical protein
LNLLATANQVMDCSRSSRYRSCLLASLAEIVGLIRPDTNSGTVRQVVINMFKSRCRLEAENFAINSGRAHAGARTSPPYTPGAAALWRCARAVTRAREHCLGNQPCGGNAADYDLLAPPLGVCAIGGVQYLSSAEIASCSRARTDALKPARYMCITAAAWTVPN